MGVRTCLYSLTIISFSDSCLSVPIIWTPSGSLMPSILRGLASTSKGTQTRKITSKTCKTSMNKRTVLEGLVLLGVGLSSRLSLLRQPEVRFGWGYSIQKVGFYELG